MPRSGSSVPCGGRKRRFDALEVVDLEKRRLVLQLEDEKLRAFELASHDHLTGLPNRRMFHELGASNLSRAKRSRQHFGLLNVDLDRLKTVNDTLGHHVGDLLLQTVASRLRSALRESDVIARLGGEEFTALLSGLDSVDDMAVIASKIVELIGRPCTNLDGHDLQISPSIGIAVFPRDGHNIETLSRHADAAMYQSKRSGRGRYTSPIPFDPFVYRARLCQPLVERIKQAFFRESAVLQDMFRSLDREGFVAVDDDHYLGIREILSSPP